jgi:hypothetical protein
MSNRPLSKASAWPHVRHLTFSKKTSEPQEVQ